MATSAIFSSLRRRRSPFPQVFLLPVDLSDVELVRMLASMAGELICKFSDGVFYFQRRNLRSMLRMLETVLLLLDCVRDRDLSLPSTAIVCFKELYMVLYRSKMIIKHCSSSARIWLLLQSRSISAYFGDLNLEISTLLDVLPLTELRISDKVRQKIEHLRRKLRRSNMVIGQKDELLRIKLYEFIDQLSHGRIPSVIDLRQFFVEGLGIRNSRECRLEIEFLEEQICSSECDSDPPASVLHEVVALARYCRFLLFSIEVEEEEETDNTNNKMVRRGLLAEEIAETFLTLPRDFCCPISLDLMSDPVIICTGQTYDRSSIRRWIEEGNCTCPKTGQILSHTNMAPNHALRNLILQWCAAHGTALDHVEDSPPPPPEACSAPSMAAVQANRATAALLVEKLGGSGATSASREIRFLAKTGKENRVYLAEAGAIPCLRNLLSSTDSSAQENSVTALLNLSIHEENRDRIMREDGCLQSIVLVLRSGKTTQARENAAATLFSLSTSHEYKKRITEEGGVLQGLASLLEEGTLRGKRDSLASIFNLCTYSENCPKIVESGAVSAVVKALKIEGVSEVAAAVLSLICRRPIGVQAVVKDEMAVPGLMEVMKGGSPRGKEHAVAALLEVFRIGGVSVSEAAVRAPALGGLLQSLLFTGTRRARRKAASLARVFRNCDDAGGTVDFQQT